MFNRIVRKMSACIAFIKKMISKLFGEFMLMKYSR